MLDYFIVLQTILLIIIVLHDWVHFPPFADIRALEKLRSKKERIISSTIYGLIVGIPLGLTFFYRHHLTHTILLNIAIFYVLLSLETIASWWIPYFFGSSAQHKAGFAEYRNTHSFLPPRSDNVRPNTFHVTMHFIIWCCCLLSLYLLIKQA